MGFLNEIGRKTSETTSRLAKETKLKIKINDDKDKISDIYEEIGKKVYEKHVREENVNIKEDLQLECEKIDNLSEEIKTARQKILELNRKKQCKRCYYEITNDAIYCYKCGEKQIENEETIFETALEKVENRDFEPENVKKAKIVKNNLEQKIIETEE